MVYELYLLLMIYKKYPRFAYISLGDTHMVLIYITEEAMTWKRLLHH